jgi:hypothetical protein
LRPSAGNTQQNLRVPVLGLDVTRSVASRSKLKHPPATFPRRNHPFTTACTGRPKALVVGSSPSQPNHPFSSAIRPALNLKAVPSPTKRNTAHGKNAEIGGSSQIWWNSSTFLGELIPVKETPRSKKVMNSFIAKMDPTPLFLAQGEKQCSTGKIWSRR